MIDILLILIFDDPDEKEGMEAINVPQGSVNCQTSVARAARAARTQKIYETLRMPPTYCPFAYKWGVVFDDPLPPNLHTEGNFQARRFYQRK
jgi:hypothetical protein